MDSAILWTSAATLIGTVGLIIAWLQLRRSSALTESRRSLADIDEGLPAHTGEGPGVIPGPLPSYRAYRRRRLGAWLPVALGLLVVGAIVFATVIEQPSSPPRPRVTATVTVTATPASQQSASSDNDDNDAALIAAIGAVIAGLGTAASGLSESLWVRR
jgi:hypothetical protein